jgi:diguanylate cyclase (GGDEF)-like protein
VLPEQAGPVLGALWLLALAPAFLLAYHQGWRGGAVAAGVAGGLALVLAAAPPAGSGEWPVDGYAMAYAAVALAAGALAEALLRDRERATRLALTDDLTGLPNRRSGRWFLDKEFAAAERGRRISVVLFDLDQFKRYNDRHGHPAGDAALRAVAQVLDRVTRRMNLAARHGGEEFLCVLSSAAAEDALVFVGKVRAELRGADIPCEPVTVSAGVATYDRSMTSPDDLLAAADRALYQAKRAGGDCVRMAAEAPADLRAAR